ncbi:MAG: hypothetical protein HOE80_01400 [Candidatus Magasanikbacteria bacterium]|jgi:hypothetical protein|nr:hypothetical protein [Candidatus Magasanikbacteria bacterium]MBT4071358.1 hypothetical protein [Candidatus Magasanikbacteria bacterium]
MESNIVDIQLALMYQTIFAGSFDDILFKYKEKYPDISNVLISLPDNFPEDTVPRLEVNHINKSIKLQFSKSRADIFFNSNVVDENILNDFITLIINLGIVVGRIGYVQKTIFSNIDMNFVKEKLPMCEYIIKEKEDDLLIEATQRINKRISVFHEEEHIECNNIAVLTFGKQDSELALLLGRDVNTMQNKNLTLRDVENTRSIINLLKEETNKTLFNM